MNAVVCFNDSFLLFEATARLGSFLGTIAHAFSKHLFCLQLRKIPVRLQHP